MYAITFRTLGRKICDWSSYSESFVMLTVAGPTYIIGRPTTEVANYQFDTLI